MVDWRTMPISLLAMNPNITRMLERATRRCFVDGIVLT
jgi:hypothetical protein